MISILIQNLVDSKRLVPLVLKILWNGFQVLSKVNGEYIIERYLYDDIWETMVVDEEFNQLTLLS